MIKSQKSDHSGLSSRVCSQLRCSGRISGIPEKDNSILHSTLSYGVIFFLVYSRHAREQMIARGIEERDVEEGIAMGSKELQRPDKILSYYKYFCVVYKKIGNDIFVITVKPR